MERDGTRINRRSDAVAPAPSYMSHCIRGLALDCEVGRDMSTDPLSRNSNTRSRSLRRSLKTLEDGTCAREVAAAVRRGVQLSRFCHAQLEAAERRVEILNERGEVKEAPAALGLRADDEGDRTR